ncbi:MAG: flagellar hook-length control protein FliK [Anaerolineales bacterium]|nr:flagellar hook-length control protein FliK [Anaerolineales bacterium]
MDLATPSLSPVTPINGKGITLNVEPSIADSFTEGQIIKASVQQVINSVVWLKTDGHLLQARTEVPLQPGQQVLLKVAGANSERVSLQLQPQTSSSLPLQIAEGKGGIETLLTSWGIEADPTNLNIAQALLTQARSVHPDDIEAIRTLWRTLPSAIQTMPTGSSAQGKQLEALTFLHVHQLPVNEESVALARHWLDGLPALTERMTNLQGTLDDALGQLNRFQPDQPALEQLRNSLLSARNQLANLPITLTKPTAEMATDLTKLTIQLGTPPEAELLTSISNSQQTINNLPEIVDSKQNFDFPIPSTIHNLLSLEEEGGKGGELARLTHVIREALSQTNLDDRATQTLHRLTDQLEQFSKDLGATQLSNLTRNPDPTTTPYYFFPIPLTTPDGTHTAQLKVYRQPGKREVDPQNLRLALLLDLPSLGEIAIDLTIFKHHLNGKFLSGQPQTRQLVDTSLGELRDSLNKLGYHVDGLTSTLLTPETQKPQQTPSLSNGIDVSA